MGKIPLDGSQPSLFKPQASWRPPVELPDLTRCEYVSIDTETYDPNLKEKGAGWCRNDGYIVGISVAWAEEGKAKALYAPFRHEGGDNLPEENVISWMNHFFKNFTGTLIGMNFMYDSGWLGTMGVDLTRLMNEEIKVRDVMWCEALLDENRRSYSLASIAETHGLPPKDERLLEEAAHSYGVDPKSGLWRLPARYVGLYGEMDAKLPLIIYSRQKKLLEENKLEKVTELEHSLIPCLLAMKRKGVRVDVAKAEQHRDDFLKWYKILLDEIKRECGLAVEVFSGDSVALGFDRLGITYPKTGRGKASFTDPWLSSHKSKMAQLVTQARKQQRAAETFCRGMVLDKHHNGRVHCEFHPLRSDAGGSGPGRFSSSNPNLQQVPGDKDPKMGTIIRSLFLPEDGEQWAAVDYCFSDDTEVLTKSGFKLFKDLTEDDELWQYSSLDKKLTLARPLAKQIIEYSGKMEHVHGKFIDMLVSPNHDCLLFRQCNLEKSFFIKAENYPKGVYGQLNAAMADDLLCPRLEKEAILILVAAVQADASIEVGKRITFSLKKQRKINRLLQTLEILKISYTKHVFKSKPTFSCIRIKFNEVNNLIADYIDTSSRIKNFKPALKELSIKLRQFFINELALWDGTTSVKNCPSYFSTNLHNITFVQELATITGIRTTRNIQKAIGKKPFGRITLNISEPITWTQTFKHDKLDYNGKIYCVTMPCSTVVVRRNGKVFITGQCQQEPRLTVHYAEERGCRRAAEAANKYRTDPNTDYHNLVASMIFGDVFTAKERKLAKIINLGLSYGMGGAKLCRSLGFPTKTIEGYNGKTYEVAGDEGAALIEKYHAAVPFIRELSTYYTQVVNEAGALRTISGRLSRFPFWESRQGGRAMGYDEACSSYGANNIRRAFTHAALNKKIQGGGADMIKISLRNLYRAGVVPLITAHDENGLSVSSPKKAKEASEIMCSCIKLRVPLLCDIDLGPSWGEAKPVLEEAA